MARVTVDGADLHVEERGTGAPILGIHGTPSCAMLWERAAATLALHGRCLTYDRRGYLRSDRAGGYARSDLAEHVEDARALLEALDASPAAVIGRSTGGLIALELALRHPESVSALILLEPAVFTLDREAEDLAADLARRTLAAAAHDPSGAAELIVRTALGDETWNAFEEELRGLVEDLGTGVMAELRGSGLDMSADPRRYTEEDLATLAMPKLVVAAEDSPRAFSRTAKLLAAMIPDAAFARVPGGHIIDPAQPVVLDFLAAHRASAR